MQLLEGLGVILSIVLYLVLLAVLTFGIMLAFAAAMGVVGTALSIPLLYVLPDVRRFLVLASGGAPDDETPPWRVALRPRFVLLAIGFGVTYGLTFLVLFIPVSEYGLTTATVGPVPILVGIPLAFVLIIVPAAYVAQRYSSAWTETTERRSVLVQWTVFVTVVVTLGTAVPIFVTQS